MTELRPLAGKLLGVATLGERGQMVLPIKARRELGLAQGDKLIVLKTANGGLLLVSPQILAELFGPVPGPKGEEPRNPIIDENTLQTRTKGEPVE